MQISGATMEIKKKKKEEEKEEEGGGEKEKRKRRRRKKKKKKRESLPRSSNIGICQVEEGRLTCDCSLFSGPQSSSVSDNYASFQNGAWL
jgi:hypothetical protein